LRLVVIRGHGRFEFAAVKPTIYVVFVHSHPGRLARMKSAPAPGRALGFWR